MVVKQEEFTLSENDRWSRIAKLINGVVLLSYFVVIKNSSITTARSVI